MEYIKKGRWKYYLVTCPGCKEKRYVRADVIKKTKCQACHRKTHGLSINANTRINEKNWLYGRWQKMKSRCKKKPSYVNRGIKVCDEWNSNFESFYKWAINNGASRELTLDRKDNDKDYSPSNCRWVTMKVQCRPGGRSGKFKKTTCKAW